MTDKTNTSPTPSAPAGAAGDFPTSAAIKALAELGVKATELQTVDLETEGLGRGIPGKVPLAFDRNTQQLRSVKGLIEEYRTAPAFRTGAAEAQTLASFIDLVNRHMDEDTAVFVDLDWKKPSFTCVVDYHRQAGGDHEPRPLKHRIHYGFPLSDRWQAWVEQNGEPMKQIEFAAFIEERIADLSAPVEADRDLEKLFQTKIADPFEIMQLSRGLAVTVDSKVSRAVTLQSGEGEMIFEEVHRDGGGQKLTVPGLFMLSLPIFFRGEYHRIAARLRYRVSNGAVVWFYQMYEPDKAVTEAVVRDRDAVRVDTGVPTYDGSPEA